MKETHALTGNRTRASRVAGENSTTEPSVLLIVSWLYMYHYFQAKRVEAEEQKMKKKAEREATRKKKKAERLKHKRLRQHDKSKSPFIQQFSSGRREVWIMPGAEMPSKSDQSGHGQIGVANDEPETTVDDYYTSFTHSEVCSFMYYVMVDWTVGTVYKRLP